MQPEQLLLRTSPFLLSLSVPTPMGICRSEHLARCSRSRRVLDHRVPIKRIFFFPSAHSVCFHAGRCVSRVWFCGATFA